mmetsp:Transcript_19709/g.58778  ORF Transcript_19709/g.58778 Transcript_19709/m.58778 type:complete len:116 (+) Transcript_19709:90-437(+)
MIPRLHSKWRMLHSIGLGLGSTSPAAASETQHAHHNERKHNEDEEDIVTPGHIPGNIDWPQHLLEECAVVANGIIDPVSCQHHRGFGGVPDDGGHAGGASSEAFVCDYPCDFGGE